ncbi:hypothetical protein BCR33DRAFT_721806 [Rhizoclosmatium globosum]|uniref:Wax synthase domain-containing protein n=1 Tax=Rhizoclosmatium globosum TaxID=329046 RepID=A0A1Y2BRX6_9FUNG|nr:hypothetical protein BCR33DRAFT_721806 [Rhizoclosmatium globosum]|eukprot:ORY36885.1 hypothetical protein BCR33DRAFT_721806 [Rhizoclosmatium globosum]
MLTLTIGTPLSIKSPSNNLALRMAGGNIGIIMLLKTIQAFVTRPSINSIKSYTTFLASTREPTATTKPRPFRIIIHKKDRTFNYWTQELTRWSALYTIYCIARILLKTFPLNPHASGIVPPWDLPGLRDQLIFFLLFYTQLELGYSIVFHFISITSKTPFSPIMYTPYLHRWNTLVKDFLAMVVFSPVMKVLTKKGSREMKFTVACLAAFVFSGLLHEYIAFLQFGVDPRGNGFEFSFFVCIETWVGRGLGWFGTMSVLLSTTRLFSAQYVRSGVGAQVSFPVPWFID